jgi:hypothetical protein
VSCRKNLLSLWGILCAFSGAILACSAPAGQVVVPQGLLPKGAEIIKEGFDSQTYNWDQYTGKEGSAGIDNKEYKISVQTPFTDLWANPSKDYQDKVPPDVLIDVEARSTDAEDNYFGVICRYVDEKNYYFLVISSDQYFGIGKVKNGLVSLINRTEMPPSDIIDQSGDNNLRAECVGSDLRLFVNGELLETQQDSDFAAGGVGLLVGSYEKPVTVFFDDFFVYSAK